MRVRIEEQDRDCTEFNIMADKAGTALIGVILGTIFLGPIGGFIGAAVGGGIGETALEKRRDDIKKALESFPDDVRPELESAIQLAIKEGRSEGAITIGRELSGGYYGAPCGEVTREIRFSIDQ